MPNSLSQSTDFTCPQCQKPFEAHVWLIIDANEQPDLIDAIQQGNLHALPCPSCGYEGQVDAPLLLYRPGNEPVLVFSPALRAATRQQVQEQAEGLLGALRQTLRDVWQDEWLAQMPVLPRNVVPTVLKDGLDAAARQMQARQAAELERLRREDPQAYRRVEEAARLREENERRLTLLQDFIRAQTWAEAQRMVEQQPQLLSGEVESLLDEWVAGAREEHDDDAVRVLETHRSLLLRCREVGVERAFRERAAPSSDEISSSKIPPEIQVLLAALQSLPEDQRQAAQIELARAATPEAFEAVLDSRPALRAAVERVLEEGRQ